jgi:spermidine/putrescine transport system substrate-binding protein
MKITAFLATFLLILATSLQAADAPGMLRVLAYDRSIPREVSLEFTEKTGIGVDVTTAISSSEAANLLYQKEASFDLLLLSNDVVFAMKKKGELLAFDHKKVPGLAKLKSQWREAAGDVQGKFRLPFDVAAMGLLVDRRITQPAVSGYMDAFRKPRPGGVAVMVDQRDMLAAALLSLGASVNELSSGNIRAAGVLLKDWLRNTAPASSEIWGGGRASAFDALRADIVEGRHGAALLYSGDAISLMTEFPDRFEWVNPVEGSLKYMTVFAIPKNSERPHSAHEFIEFLLQPQIASQIIIAPGFGIPLAAPWANVPLSFHGNPAELKAAQLMDDFSVQADITREPRQDLDKLFKSLPPPSAPASP